MAVITIREALKQAMREEMQRDERVFLMGEDIAAYGGSFAVTKGLVDEFGEERVRDTPISEGVIVGAAMGAAMGGQRPIAEIMTINFAILAMDQLINHAAKMHHMFGGQWTVPLVVRMAAGWGQLSATHSQTLEVFFAHVPGLKVLFPGTPYDSKGLLKAAVRDADPVVFIEHTSLYGVKGEVPEGDYVVPIGKSDLKRPGKHCTIATYGRMLQVSLEAAKQLEGDGIDVEIVDLRTLRPLDMEPVLDSVKKTNHAVVVTEEWPSFGVGAEVAARIAHESFDDLDAPVERVGSKEVPLPYAKNLEQAALPWPKDVVAAVKTALA
ncbi:MAG: alpha-ketoacid dehydrogenase subunit beta [Thermoflexales bacterium]|nr:alpha-ketoacid dehydrogenase subunit beta [Thermoflexales bacterium]